MKLKTCFIVVGMVTSLTGCRSVENAVEENMLKKSGLSEEVSYQNYEKYALSGQLDSDGYFSEEETATPEPNGSICLTFAKNSNLETHYYKDAAHDTEISDEEYYLNPGDSVYAAVPVNAVSASSMYGFSAFRIYERGSDNAFILSDTLEMKKTADGYVLTIPADYTNTDVSIEPIGVYQSRTIALNDYYTDNDGEHSLSGTWTVNDKPCTEESVKIDPISSYVVSYQYNSDEYFFRSSKPEYAYQGNEAGIVVFKQQEPSDETTDYSVALCPYFSESLVSDRDRKVSVNGEETTVAVNEELTIPHLKYGDVIILKTDQAWKSLENSQNLILMDTRSIAEEPYKYQYTLTVPEKDSEFVFDPKEYSKCAHGTLTFKCFGQTVNTPQYLAKGSKIYYEEQSADDGYWLSGKDASHCITVSNEESTRKELENIHFTKKVNVLLSLPQPEIGGAIIYKLNGEEIEESEITVYSGTDITMKCDPWEGWIAPAGEVIYTVDESMSQSATFGGKDISAVFTEDEGHKPRLKLALEKSVGQAMEFTLKASGYSMDMTHYGGGWKVSDLFSKNTSDYGRSNQEYVINGQKIGTDQPIMLTMSNRAIQSGKAVRIKITMTDTAGNTSTELRYVDDLTNEVEPIYIYQPGTNADDTIWYSTVGISIGVVDIERYEAPKAAAHTNVTVRCVSTGEELTNGMLIEGSQKVRVSITPEQGYHITGKKVSGDSFAKTLTFDQYLKQIGSLIDSHPAAEYYMITLDHSDPYADYVYKLDGKVVSGEVYVKEGQKLTLTYEITDPNHRLTEARGGVPFIKLGASATKAEESIFISREMNGTKLTKSDFHIETEKAE